MEEDRVSKQDRNALRKERNTLRQAKTSDYVRELMNDLEGRPEEVSFYKLWFSRHESVDVCIRCLLIIFWCQNTDSRNCWS